MTRTFADTSFYVALLNPADSLHAVAVDRARRLGQEIVTTEFVLLELANFVSRATQRDAFVRLMGLLRDNPRTLLVESSHELFAAGYELFRARGDKDWSLTDCTSFVVMDRLQLTDALTADRHFEQAGFQALLARGKTSG